MDVRLPIWVVVASGVVFGALIATVSKSVRGMPLLPAAITGAIAAVGYVAGFGLLSWAAAVTG